MRAHNGGDGPERQLRALLKTLDAKDAEGLAVLIPGSEIVLLTDAPSHDPELEDDVITKANEKQVCISFYLSGTYALWEGYQNISDETGGTVVDSLDHTSFRTFQSTHEYGQCAHFYELPFFAKRQAPSSSYTTEQQCHNFTTSLFTTTIVVWGYSSEDSMIVTKPNGEKVSVITNFRGDKFFYNSAPPSGQWSVCVETGNLTISLEKTDSMSSILKYLTPIVNSSEFSLNVSPPPACKCV